MTTVGFGVVNAPQKVTATATSLRTEVRRLLALHPDGVGVPDPSIFFFTEVAAHARAAALIAIHGITTTHQGGPGMGECAILTRDSRWKVLEQHWLTLTEGGGKARLTNPIVAPAVVLEGPGGHIVVATNAHLPAHLEGIWAAILRRDPRLLSRSALHNPVIATWVEAVKSWRKQVKALVAAVEAAHPDAVVDGLVFADFNLSIFRPWVRRLIAATWPELDVVHTAKPDLGSRNIGWGLVSPGLVLDGQHVYGTASSDHQVGLFGLKRKGA